MTDYFYRSISSFLFRIRLLWFWSLEFWFFFLYCVRLYLCMLLINFFVCMLVVFISLVGINLIVALFVGIALVATNIPLKNATSETKSLLNTHREREKKKKSRLLKGSKSVCNNFCHFFFAVFFFGIKFSCYTRPTARRNKKNNLNKKALHTQNLWLLFLLRN